VADNAENARSSSKEGAGCGYAIVGLILFVFLYPFLSAFSVFPYGWGFIEVSAKAGEWFDRHFIAIAAVTGGVVTLAAIFAVKSGELSPGQLALLVLTEIVLGLVLGLIF